MRSKAYFSSGVCCADSFFDLSVSAQALYFQLGFEANGDGVVSSIRSVARKCGYSKEETPALIDELVAKGFLLEILDTHLITHWWANNNRDRYNYRAGERKDVMAFVYCDPDSRVYCRVTESTESDRLTLVCHQSDVSLKDKVSEDKETEVKPSKAKRSESKQTEKKKEAKPAQQTKTAHCPRCGSTCAAQDDYGTTIGYCPQCNEEFEMLVSS